MSIDRTKSDGLCWPSHPLLIVCAVIALAGYVAGIVSGQTPSGPVNMVVFAAPDSAAPAEQK